jgi:hypothetical protein
MNIANAFFFVFTIFSHNNKKFPQPSYVMKEKEVN